MFNQADLSIQIYKKVQVYILSLKKYFAADCALEKDLHLQFPIWMGFRMNFIGSGSVRSKYLNMTKRIQARSVTSTHKLRVLLNQERVLVELKNCFKSSEITEHSYWAQSVIPQGGAICNISWGRDCHDRPHHHYNHQSLSKSPSE